MGFRLPFEERARDTKRKKAYRAFFSLAFLTLLAAYVFSSFPETESGRQSAWLKEFLSRLTGWEWSELLLRKLAHLSEYALIGLFAGAALVQLDWKLKDAALLWGLGLPAAFLDETIQVFSGRGPAIIDVWIDVAGVIIGSSLAILLFGIRPKKGPDEENPPPSGQA